MGTGVCGRIWRLCGRQFGVEGRCPWRFLPSQEWSSGEREIVGGFWYCCRPWLRDSCFRRNGLGGYGSVCAYLAIVWATIWRGMALPLEIPASAGMVYGVTGVWVILAIVHIRYCEIPAFAGMVSGDGSVCACLAIVGATIWRGRALPLEIPAFAGMVYGVNGSVCDFGDCAYTIL